MPYLKIVWTAETLHFAMYSLNHAHCKTVPVTVQHVANHFQLLGMAKGTSMHGWNVYFTTSYLTSADLGKPLYPYVVFSVSAVALWQYDSLRSRQCLTWSVGCWDICTATDNNHWAIIEQNDNVPGNTCCSSVNRRKKFKIFSGTVWISSQVFKELHISLKHVSYIKTKQWTE